MSDIISLRLGEEYIKRLDSICAMCSLNRAQLIRWLLSGDESLVDIIAIKAKTLEPINIGEALAKGKNKTAEG